MSWSARRWAWNYGTKRDKPTFHEPLKPSTKLVLTALAELENVQQGYAWPSLAELAETTGLSRRSVVDQVAELERLRLVTVRRKRLRSGLNAQNHYRLNVPEVYRDEDRTWNAVLAERGQEWDEEEEEEEEEEEGAADSPASVGWTGDVCADPRPI